MGFAGMPAGTPPPLLAPRRQQEAERCRVLCQAGIIPALLGRAPQAAAGRHRCLCLQEGARAGGCRAGHGGPGGIWASREPSGIPQMVQRIWAPGRDGASFLPSEPSARGRAPAAVLLSVPPSRPACPLPGVAACRLPGRHPSCPWHTVWVPPLCHRLRQCQREGPWSVALAGASCEGWRDPPPRVSPPEVAWDQQAPGPRVSCRRLPEWKLCAQSCALGVKDLQHG